MAVINVDIPALHVGQRRIVDASSRFNVVRAGRRFGKSILFENMAALTAIDGKAAGWFAPTVKLLAPSWRRLLRITKPVARDISKTEKRIELITGGVLEFWSVDNPDSAAAVLTTSLSSTRPASCAGLAEVWQDSIRSTLTDRRGSAWIGGTPRGRGFFAELFDKGQAGHQGWSSWQCPTSANPYIDPAEIADAQRDLPAHVFAQEYLAEPADDGANPFGLAHLKACLIPALAPGPAVAYGVDLAKRHDWTVITGLDAQCRVCEWERFQLPWHLTRQRILEVVGDVPTTIDATGVGDPIVEDLQRARSNINGVVFTSSLTSKQQWLEWLIGAVQAQSIGFPDGVLHQELQSFIFEYKPGGRIVYKAPGGLFDDCVMSLALALKQFRKLTRPGSEFWVGGDEEKDRELTLAEQLALAEEEEAANEEADRAAFR